MSESDEATKQDKPSRSSQPSIAVHPDFGPRYRVIGVIGKGGMGEVFRAYDTELKGEVALKVVRGDADHDAALARFRREIALARKVTSPNVLRVYDLDEHDGLRFLSMEYVDGDDLAAVMRREKHLPLDRAVAIFRQVCQGLVAAHAEGVVHRDLKPQNVLVDKEGRVRVADFGLARSIGDSGLTTTGAVLGSPAYMSPEQVKGDPTDERSDIYSLGIMLYQLVTGETPFQAGSPHAVMEMRLHKKAPLLRDVRADAPAHLEAICAKCLALTPSARYASVGALLAVLEADRSPAAARQPRPRWLVPAIAAATAVVAAAIVAVLAWPRGPARAKPEAPAVSPAAVAPRPAPAPTSSTTRVLVLGFENHTNEPMFDGTLDTAIYTALRRSQRLDPVIKSEVRNLAAELGVEGILDDRVGKKLAERDNIRVITVHGTVTAKGAGFAIALEARDAGTGARLTESTVDASGLTRVIPAIAQLASNVRTAVGEEVPKDDHEHAGLSASLEAAHEYSTCGAMVTSNSTNEAITHCRQAIAHDPGFALAYQLLAVALWNVHREADAREQLKLGTKSIDQLGERDRLRFLADYYDTVDEDHDRAISMYEQLLAKWPSDLSGAINLSLAYQARGDIQKALKVGEQAVREHARDATSRANLVQFQLLAGDYARAITSARQMVADTSRPVPAVFEYLELASFLIGRRDDAIAALDQYEKADAAGAATARADLASAEGRLREASSILEKGIASDQAAKRVEAAEVKQTILAELELRRGDRARARAAAAGVKIDLNRRLEASIVLLAAGDERRATETASHLAAEAAPSPRAAAKLIDGEALRLHGKPQQAIIAEQEALHLVDSPFGHFMLARAELDAKHFTEAYNELQVCIARRGEASVGVDDVPALHRIPLFTYYLAKAQDGLGSPDAAKSYAAFLAMQHEPDADDPLVVDARKHVQ